MKNLRFIFLSLLFAWSTLFSNFAKADDCNLSTFAENQFGEFVTCFNEIKNKKNLKSILNQTLYYYFQPGVMGSIQSVPAEKYSSIEKSVRLGINKTLNLKSEDTEVINALVDYDCEGYTNKADSKDYFTKGLLWSYRPVVKEIIKDAKKFQDIFASYEEVDVVKAYQVMIDQFKFFLPLKQGRLVDPANNMHYDFFFSEESKSWKLFYIEMDECSA